MDKVLANRSVENRWQAIVAVVEDLAEEAAGLVSVRAAIESCSGAAHLAEELIERAGWSVTLGHPGIVNRMKQNPDKSDKADAFVLADLMQLARYCGVTPRNASSGQKQADAGLVKAGNTGLRIVLVQAAHRLMNLSSHWGRFCRTPQEERQAAQRHRGGRRQSLAAAAVLPDATGSTTECVIANRFLSSTTWNQGDCDANCGP